MRTFIKCDFHIHSSSDFSRTYSESDCLDALESSGLDCVAITDHNGIDLDLYKRAKARLDSKGIGLLAGVELNLKLSQTTIGEYGLYVATKPSKSYFHAIVLASIDDIEQLSNKVDKLFIDAGIFTQGDVNSVANGAMSRKSLSIKADGKAIDLAELQTALQSLPHYFIPHESKGSRNLSDYLPIRCPSSGQTKANSNYRNSLFYYNHGQAVEGGEKSRGRISNRLSREYNSTVAALLFSDAKELQEIGAKYTWIDFDGDLASLQLAISDPESRIRTSEQSTDNPQLNLMNYLESISFDTVSSQEESGEHYDLKFVPGYNGIVGSRGSGKSLLAHVLVGENLNPYKDIIDISSIRYKRFGGVESSNPPSYLYLGQGALEKIFENEDYSDIPVLEQIISSQKKACEEKSSEAANSIDSLLDLQEKLLEAFMKRYSTGCIHFDFLKKPEPSGVSLPVPSACIPSDKDKVSRVRDSFLTASELIDQAKTEIDDIELDATYPENQFLMQALVRETNEIKGDLVALETRISRFAKTVDQASVWFEDREWLVAQFCQLLSDSNRKDNSILRNDYLNKRDESKSFLRDLLELRIAVSEIDYQIDCLRNCQLAPLPDDPCISSAKQIVVKFGYIDECSYSDIAGNLIKGRNRTSEEALVLTCLNQNEPIQVKGLYNGSKFKLRGGASAGSYIKKYFELLKGKLRLQNNLKTEIELDGASLSNMSPGMRADALLQLFLEKASAGNGPCYIVLDQPEDNLDVRTISHFLVDKLKSMKFDIQLFVVSHSAPVIVNGDARLIVSCQEDEGKISYGTGVLSDDKTKQIVADVLDGGERYLKMRFNKYNFQLGDNR